MPLLLEGDILAVQVMIPCLGTGFKQQLFPALNLINGYNLLLKIIQALGDSLLTVPKDGALICQFVFVHCGSLESKHKTTINPGNFI